MWWSIIIRACSIDLTLFYVFFMLICNRKPSSLFSFLIQWIGTNIMFSSCFLLSNTTIPVLVILQCSSILHYESNYLSFVSPLPVRLVSSHDSLLVHSPSHSSFPFFPPTSLQNRNEKEWCFIVFHLGTKFTTTTQFPLHFSPSFIVFLTKSRKSENDDNFRSFTSQSECSSMTHLLSQSF